ncbi:hypothetical protein PV08_03997 [Exophiala spinifera]|uniref:Clr5 domain-containing protein n=1 Tax=Exophiala spinifera TaxID=91928 RepID=A0A0D1ZVR4_9EURO|nr:uncharacterized protein PV08_03997 [Exophiala spinifera]KIW16807.1 hypothetical protein PV08_03997 [Exophiala spinifera]
MAHVSFSVAKKRPGQQKRTYTRLKSPLNACRHEIERLYMVDGWELRRIIHHITINYGITQSVKQYKDQLKSWDVRKNHTCTDAAFILRLLNQARSEGRPREEQVVLFSSFPRRREDIAKYIKRSKLKDEDDLLSKISDADETPPHIKLLGSPIEPNFPQVLLTPPSELLCYPSAPVGYSDLLNLGMPTPDITPQSTPQRSEQGNESKRSSLATSEEGSYIMDLDPDSFYIPVGHTSLPPQPAIGSIIRPFKLEPQQEYFKDCEIPDWSVEVTHALLSSTPPNIKDLGFDAARFGIYTQSPQLNDGTDTAWFVTNCLYWLICVGQEDPSCTANAPYYLDQAKFFFLCMISDPIAPGESCIVALTVANVLFNCLGHTERLLELLTEMDEVTKMHLGGNNPLRLTIAFEKNILHPNTRGSCIHDLEQLRYVHSRMRKEYPNSHGPALMAKYHIAWAMLENELKADKRKRNFLPVKGMLEGLLQDFKSHFGPHRIEITMAAATLARATFRSGDAEKAEGIIADEVLPRLRQNFPEDHPYTWEAKHRHAYFLYQLAKYEPGLTGKRRLQHGEQILREVVRERRRVLGEGNVKSIKSFELLKTILEKQGKTHEASSLWQWCERQL